MNQQRALTWATWVGGISLMTGCCATGPQMLAPDNRAVAAGVVSVRGGIIKPGMSYHPCPTTSCFVDVEVAVDTSDATGRTCKFTVPDVVVVREHDTTVTWQLVNSTRGTNFTSDGIDIRQVSGDEFSSPAASSTTYSWFSKNRAFRAHAYNINVQHAFGTVKKCDRFDPVIINRGD